MRDSAAACSSRMPVASTRQVEGSSRDGAARFWQVDGRQSRGRGYLCEHSHRQGLQVPLVASIHPFCQWSCRRRRVLESTMVS